MHSGLASELERLLKEPLPSVIAREQHSLEELLAKTGNKTVLFGAGNLGRRTLQALRSIGVEPLAFSDNNARLWNTTVEGMPVLSPEVATQRFGGDAVFIVTIWTDSHWYTDTHAQLSKLGCTMISPPSPVYWRFPESFLPFFAQDQPRKVFEEADAVLEAQSIWSDERSRAEYVQQIRWRAVGDWNFHRPTDDSYFPQRLFQLNRTESFLDCGAYDGCIIKAFLERCDGMFRRIIAIEPDDATFGTLETYVSTLPAAVKEKIAVRKCVVGAQRGDVGFAALGTVLSHVSDHSDRSIACFPITDVVGNETITYIKMDIEGSEYDALLGARHVIQRDHPLLAVCVYHNQHDIWRIPLLIRQMVPEYRMYLRQHDADGWQTVAYAVPPNRAMPTHS